ncbi:protein S100-A13 [Chanos chanos]|uniref:Protein S100-A13 n=1 Tax=Chanos chanos TaxID=29144 RepID=A0A6J2W5X6_CHACN|nr:protein S100-A13-like [Chanos chanos]
MESAIKTVVTQFLGSARGKENMDSKNFQKLVKNQLGNILSGSENSSAVKDMMKGLDDNEDGKVSFQEYMKLVGYLACQLSEQRAQGQTSTANGE